MISIKKVLSITSIDPPPGQIEPLDFYIKIMFNIALG